MKKELKFKVNGQPYDIFVKPKTLLSEVLRDELGLTGTKRGCNSSSCGACTVIMDGNPILSCSTLAIEAQGKDITTIEGLSEDGGHTLHPIQQAFVDEGATQCGFCTPGMIMAAEGLLRNNPDPDDAEIKIALGGNLCRCTGYVKIIKSVKIAASEASR